MTQSVQQATQYTFETSEFGINDEEIQLLRSGFVYETIARENISTLKVGRGKELNNWPIILLLGVGILGFSFYTASNIITFFSNEIGGSIYVEEIVVPIITFLVGIFFVFKSFATGNQLFVQTHTGKSKKLPVKSIVKSGEFKEFEQYIGKWRGMGV